MTVTVDKVIKSYIATRDHMDELKRQLAAQLSELQDLQDKRAQWIDQELRKQQERGLSPSLKTAEGVAFYTTKESVRVGDWDQVLGYIKDNEAWELLTRAVKKDAALEIIGESRDITKLPGVNYTSFKEVVVRRG